MLAYICYSPEGVRSEDGCLATIMMNMVEERPSKER